MRILLVEDDIALRDTLVQALQQAGYGVDPVNDGRSADHALCTGSYDLTVLDLGLPRMDGMEVLRRMRTRHDRTPVLVLTARDSVEQRVEGLNSGADDYLAKPFALPELEARVAALIRRSQGGKSRLGNGPLSLDLRDRTVTLHGQPLALGRREAAILGALMLKLGNVVIKTRLAQQLSDWEVELGNNAIEVYIHRLRKKLEPHGFNIRTIHGLGYLMEPHDAL